MSTTTAISVDEIIDELAEVGVRQTELDAAEGAAGNLSIFVRALEGVQSRFPSQVKVDLPARSPALAGGWVAVTGTGRRLRDVGRWPEKTLCFLRIHPGGERATQFTTIPLRPTSEFNSHLAIHDDQVSRRNLDYHAVLHSQPIHLTFLSHLPRYANEVEFNQRLMRWEPETLAHMPEGIGLVPYTMQGSSEQMEATLRVMRDHRIVIWAKHGVVSRSEVSLRSANDLVEYAETAARYEYMNLQLGEPSQGIPPEDLVALCRRYGIQQRVY